MSEEVENKVMFCPDVGGPCIGPGCVVYSSNMVIQIKDAKEFAKQTVDFDLDYELPMSFNVQVNGCGKYGKVIDKESYILLEEFKHEINTMNL